MSDTSPGFVDEPGNIVVSAVLEFVGQRLWPDPLQQLIQELPLGVVVSCPSMVPYFVYCCVFLVVYICV